MTTFPTRPGPLKIHVLSLAQSYGGAERSLEVVVHEWIQSHEVTVFVENEDHAQSLAALDNPRLTIVRMSKGKVPWAVLSNALLFGRHVSRHQPDAILANTHKSALVLTLWKLLHPRARIPTALYIRSFDWYSINFILRLLPRALLFKPSPYLEEHPYYAHTLLRKRKVITLQDAVSAPAREHESGSGKDYITCLAVISRWKGIHYLIEAFRKIADEIPAAKLRIVGDAACPEYLDELKKQVARTPLAARVVFTPFVRDVGPIYDEARFVTVASTSDSGGPETFSRVVIESWAARRAVVAFAVGGPTFLIEHEKTGLLVPERDIHALAAAMKRLWLDDPYREKIAEAGLNEVKARYRPEEHARDLLQSILQP